MGKVVVHHALTAGLQAYSNDQDTGNAKQSETACLKLLAVVKKYSQEEDLTFTLSREIESMCSVELCIFVKQLGDLYVI